MVGGKPKHVVSYMKDFLFAPEQTRTPLGVLSGGERGRLMLARALAKPSNLLVLDEPTNDLDLETLDVLEEMLGDYDGTVLLISHDRDFLDRVVTSRDRARGQRPLDRICRRLHRHAGAARRRPDARGARRPRPTIRRSETGRRPSAASKRRLSFNDKHALETLPKTIAKLQAEIAKQQRLLDDPDLYPEGSQEIRPGLRCAGQGAEGTGGSRGPMAGTRSAARRD